MQDIASTSSNPAAAAPASAPSSDSGTETAEASTALDSDFETFLTLLTSQLRNQDPLKPLDSTEFVAQLASFSAVEQQINTNKKLDGLLGALSSSGIDEASRLIDRHVQANASQIEIETPGEIEFQYDLPIGATGAVLRIQSASGQPVQDLPLSLLDENITWDGNAANGSPVPPGSYTISIEAVKDLDALEGGQVQISGLVEEAHLGAGDIMLVLDNGLVISPGDVRTIRAAESVATDPDAEDP